MAQPPRPSSSGPVPLLQQRMESNPQAPLQAPPSAAANPPELPLPPKILNIKKEVIYYYSFHFECKVIVLSNIL